MNIEPEQCRVEDALGIFGWKMEADNPLTFIKKWHPAV